jgi:hypothetical protein
VRIQDGGSASDLDNQQGVCVNCHGFKIVAEQMDLTFGTRLREAGAVVGEPAPRGWRHLKAFGGKQ